MADRPGRGSDVLADPMVLAIDGPGEDDDAGGDAAPSLLPGAPQPPAGGAGAEGGAEGGAASPVWSVVWAVLVTFAGAATLAAVDANLRLTNSAAAASLDADATRRARTMLRCPETRAWFARKSRM